MTTEITKESLLNFALTADLAEVKAMHEATRARLAELRAVGVGFTPFPKRTKATGALTQDEIVAWVPTVRQPEGSEFADRALRNSLVYEVEKLGEFCETLAARLHNRLPSYA